MWRWFPAVVLVLGFAGCTPIGAFRTARILDQGKTEVGLVGGVIGMEGFRTSYGSEPVEISKLSEVQMPLVAVQARHGLSEHVDLGGRVSFLGGEVEVGLGFVEGPFAFAVAPSVGARKVWEKLNLDAQVPLLVGVDLIPAHPRMLEVTLGLVGRFERAVIRGPDTGLYLGGSLGVSVRPIPWLFFRVEGLYMASVYSSLPPLETRPSSVGTDSTHLHGFDLLLGMGVVL